MEQSVEEYKRPLFWEREDQVVRVFFLEQNNYASVDERKWEESFSQILSFIQANSYLCLWHKLPEHQYIFLVAHSPEHSPSMMYLLHLKLVYFAGAYGTN